MIIRWIRAVGCIVMHDTANSSVLLLQKFEFIQLNYVNGKIRFSSYILKKFDRCTGCRLDASDSVIVTSCIVTLRRCTAMKFGEFRQTEVWFVYAASYAVSHTTASNFSGVVDDSLVANYGYSPKALCIIHESVICARVMLRVSERNISTLALRYRCHYNFLVYDRNHRSSQSAEHGVSDDFSKI